MMWASSKVIILYAILTPHTAMGGQLDPQKVFTTLSLITVVTLEMQQAIFGVLQIARMIVANIRIQVTNDISESAEPNYQRLVY